jgi:hypothetical protein
MPILTPNSPEFIAASSALTAYDFIMRQTVEYPGLEYIDPPKGPGFQCIEENIAVDGTCMLTGEDSSFYRISYLDMATMTQSVVMIERNKNYLASRREELLEGSLAVLGIIDLRKKIQQI